MRRSNRNMPPDKPWEFDFFLRSTLTSKAFPEWGIWSFLVGWGQLKRKCKVSTVFFFLSSAELTAVNTCLDEMEVTAEYPATRSCTPQNRDTWLRSLCTLFLCLVFKRRNSRYAANWLGGYVAHWLKNELNSYVACLFRLKDYCSGTLIKERVKFLCGTSFST